jgi:lipoprotein-releasing system permease protein
MRLLAFLALRQLWARRGLNGIAVCGVALGVLALVAMKAIMGGFQQEFKENVLRAADHVILHDRRIQAGSSILAGITAKGPLLEHVRHRVPNDRSLRIARPQDTLRMIRSLPEVEAACGELIGQTVFTFGQRSQGVNLHGIVPNEQERCTPLEGYVRSGSWKDFAASRDGILLGTIIADNLGVHTGDHVTVVGPNGISHSLKVVGVFEAMVYAIDRAWAFVPLSVAQAVFGQANAISDIGVRAVEPFAAPELTSRLERLTGYDAESWQEMNSGTLSIYSLQNIIVAFQIGAILVVGGFGILAVQIMIVLQKTRDIAILRSVGLRRVDILIVFLLQGAAVAATGAMTGDLLGWRLIAFLDSLYDPTLGYHGGAQLRVYDDPLAYVWGAVFALVIGLFASLLPAWRGSRVEPVEVLRGQLG